MELCNHDSCVCGCEPYIGNLSLVCPAQNHLCDVIYVCIGLLLFNVGHLDSV